ncbi:MBL fold metallo-hydrolase [Paenibacillus wulumuqiensis]|uniref:MBL fold metallo-hydrolase n=1 Tax=Paenibacillus wulumuqiensis TaxID=1567107 RepID=UPI0006192C4E|nr:MBL fold metallo-hydrolase [Paenibacillus wulumuqiensis]
MHIQQIRNATILIHYAGQKFLVDPLLADKGLYDPFAAGIREDLRNPIVDLPMSVHEIIKDIDAVILTHLHLDHYDDIAKAVLPKNINVFVQNEEDAAKIKNDGFEQVEVLTENTHFKGIQLIKTKGEHGRGEDLLNIMGEVCGVVFKHVSEKTLYLAGDTVWYEGVENEINSHTPEIIVLNAGDNSWHDAGSLIMGKEDVYEVHQAAPNAKIISVHMEAVNHWTLSRQELKSFAEEKGFTSSLFVPEDGEAYTF